jgi:ABC-type sugar transport system permease subunit
MAGQQYIGLENFKTLVNNPQYMAATARTLFFVAISLVIQMGLGLAIAVTMGTLGAVVAGWRVLRLRPLDHLRR